MPQIKTNIKYTSYRIKTNKIKSIIQQFGIYDKKGREIGCTGFISIETFVNIRPNKNICSTWCILPGVYFKVYLHKTKNGECFGPSSGGNYFTYFNECLEYINKRILKMKKI
jgi:hypothetical protein